VTKVDFLVIGAGAVGLAISREIKIRYPSSSVTVIEKEPSPGLHSSGRNSGVLHSGIYYPPTSIKAKVCGQGAKEMAEFCQRRGLPLKRIGKVLVPVCAEDDPQLDLLADRARANGIDIQRLDQQQLKELEPEVYSATGRALFVPVTAVVDPQMVINALVEEVKALGVKIETGTQLQKADIHQKIAAFSNQQIAYGHVINAAGLHADRVAHLFGVGSRYTLLPFKGIYWKLKPESGIKINHLVYPVPDLRVPFLGVHTTTTTDGSTYLGPTAVPAFGRENYYGMQDVTPFGALGICSLLAQQVISGRDGFRRLAWQEGRRYFKPWFTDAARLLIPRLRSEHLSSSDKVGIRAQMLDKESHKLVSDFVIDQGLYSTHILNAISPAFTSAFPFARFVLDNFLENSQPNGYSYRTSGLRKRLNQE
jgi:L-2-hydroxyglutarate oxidase LhgO